MHGPTSESQRHFIGDHGRPYPVGNAQSGIALELDIGVDIDSTGSIAYISPLRPFFDLVRRGRGSRLDLFQLRPRKEQFTGTI